MMHALLFSLHCSLQVLEFISAKEFEQKIINDKIDELLEMKLFKTITTEVKKFEKFYLAEEYHQDYKKKNPYNPYIMKVSAPRINKFKLNYSELLKQN